MADEMPSNERLRELAASIESAVEKYGTALGDLTDLRGWRETAACIRAVIAACELCDKHERTTGLISTEDLRAILGKEG